MADNDTRSMKALESMAQSAKAMTKAGEDLARIFAKLQHPAFAGMPVTGALVSQDDISTSIVLSNPDIEGKTTIYKQDDGFLRIEILVEPPESERLMELVSQMPVTQFVMQALDVD